MQVSPQYTSFNAIMSESLSPVLRACRDAAHVLWEWLRDDPQWRPYVDPEPPQSMAFRVRFANEGPYQGLSICVPSDKNYPGLRPEVKAEPDCVEVALFGGEDGNIASNEDWGYYGPQVLFSEEPKGTYRDVFPELVEQLRCLSNRLAPRAIPPPSP